MVPKTRPTELEVFRRWDKVGAVTLEGVNYEVRIPSLLACINFDMQAKDYMWRVAALSVNMSYQDFIEKPVDQTMQVLTTLSARFSATQITGRFFNEGS